VRSKNVVIHFGSKLVNSQWGL